LLMRGTTWVPSKNEVTIKLGNKTIKSDEEKAEAGTGYFKTVIPGNKVQQGMGNIEVSISSEKDTGTNLLPSWGAVYWQYFEEIDKITRAITPLYLSKKLYLQKNTDTGPVLEEIKEGSEINVGAKIIVRLHLKCDRDMEYIHLKDMRASGLEPVNVISQFKYQGGLWYYETTRDASSNFFFDKLPKGSYIFEYPLFATHAGDFSLGIATIQSMYAPEFTSHSEGMRIHILPQIP
ncbi:MAG: alpha-2-macroglobulin, partial [Flavobacteriales bacterium]|nr:alpha-2-macroglobulin [Flavobacteriales bacterium]